MKYAPIAIVLLVACSIYPNLCASANDGPNADNTRLNVRDTNRHNPTAQDQSNAKPFVETAAKLRREIMRTKGLSMDAQNVKIIDLNGYVVLRGPVDSQQEKQTIDKLAHQYCGVNVNNELEVKTK